MPKLSIIIPVYNSEKYLYECLKSIEEEFSEDIEVIVVDDGSSDKSSSIYKKFTQFKNYKNENHGVSYSRNFGIEHSCGDYIMFVDADDYLSKNWKKNVFDFILNNQDCDILFFSSTYKNIINPKKLYDYIFQFDKSLNWFSPTWSKIYKRDLIKKNNIRYNEKIINGEDMIFNMYCVYFSKKNAFSCKNIYNFRVNNFSSTRKFNPKFFDSNEAFFCEIEKMIKKDENIFGKYLDYTVVNSIKKIIQKLSFIDLKYCSKYFDVFETYRYKKYISNYKNSKKISDKTYLFLLSKKMYYTLILKEKILTKLKKLKRFNTAGEFIIKI